MQKLVFAIFLLPVGVLHQREMRRILFVEIGISTYDLIFLKIKLENFEFRLIKKDKNCDARAGVIKTPHGEVSTPVFIRWELKPR